MTDDLVKRLRDECEDADDPIFMARATLLKAAARIEQLEAALRRVIAVADRDTEDFRFARAALGENKETNPLVWPDPSPPTEGVSHYDHIIAHGFTIEWKSWKDYPQYVVTRDQINEKLIGCFHSLDEAKAAVRAALGEKKE
jgi:hypothetical protein